MHELAWFAVGAAAAAAATHLLRSRTRRDGGRRTPNRPPTSPAAGALAGGPAAAPAPPAAKPADVERVVACLADELANLVSGVAGCAHHLVECAPQREHLPAAAEQLLAAVQRLRTLHAKLLACGRIAPERSGSAELPRLVRGLFEELQHLQLGLELQWNPPPALPAVAANPDAIRLALLFACSELLRVECGATHLSIDAELWLANAEPWVQVELALEWVAESERHHADAEHDAGFSIDRQAAENLVRSQGGEIRFMHLPGRAARALLRLPAAAAADAADTPLPLAPRGAEPRRHRYGGALVLEGDPAIRAMVAAELKATGRAVFACADGAAARSFLEATPERFEVLIVDHHQRLDPNDTFGRAIRDLVPQLKVCVLGPRGGTRLAGWPAAHCIEKPFGVHELRQALASVLTDG